jgi:hypothetical protein
MKAKNNSHCEIKNSAKNTKISSVSPIIRETFPKITSPNDNNENLQIHHNSIFDK